MRPLDLTRLLFARPFKPFRLYVLENTAFEVRHPEMAALGLSTLTIQVLKSGLSLDIGAQEVIVSLRHITRIEFLPSAKAADGNGG